MASVGWAQRADGALTRRFALAADAVATSPACHGLRARANILARRSTQLARLSDAGGSQDAADLSMEYLACEPLTDWSMRIRLDWPGAPRAVPRGADASSIRRRASDPPGPKPFEIRVTEAGRCGCSIRSGHAAGRARLTAHPSSAAVRASADADTRSRAVARKSARCGDRHRARFGLVLVRLLTGSRPVPRSQSRASPHASWSAASATVRI